MRDDIVFYRTDGTTYVARLIGVPGDRLTFDPLSVSLDGKLLVRAPPGKLLDTTLDGVHALREDEYAVYVHKPPKGPYAGVISRDVFLGPLDRYLRSSEFDRADWLWIAVSLGWLMTLLALPFKAYFSGRPLGILRTVLFVPHVLITALFLGYLATVAVGMDVLGPEFTALWWLVPWMILRNTGAVALLCVLAFLALRGALSRLRPLSPPV
jgi:hypothetical protein